MLMCIAMQHDMEEQVCYQFAHVLNFQIECRRAQEHVHPRGRADRDEMDKARFAWFTCEPLSAAAS